MSSGNNVPGLATEVTKRDPANTRDTREAGSVLPLTPTSRYRLKMRYSLGRPCKDGLEGEIALSPDPLPETSSLPSP